MSKLQIKKISELKPLNENASVEDVKNILRSTRKILAKRLALALKKPKAKLFDEAENEKYILEVAAEDLPRVIFCYNLVLVFSNSGIKIFNAGADGINNLISVIAPMLIKRAFELVTMETSEEDAAKISQEDVSFVLSAFTGTTNELAEEEA